MKGVTSQQLKDPNWWYTLSRNPDLTFEFILKNLDREWDWWRISLKDWVTEKVVGQHPNLPWQWNLLTRKKWVTPLFVEQHINKDWDWWTLSGKKWMTETFVGRHLDKGWNWNALRRLGIRNEFIDQHDKREVYRCHVQLKWSSVGQDTISPAQFDQHLVRHLNIGKNQDDSLSSALTDTFFCGIGPVEVESLKLLPGGKAYFEVRKDSPGLGIQTASRLKELITRRKDSMIDGEYEAADTDFWNIFGEGKIEIGYYIQIE